MKKAAVLLIAIIFVFVSLAGVAGAAQGKVFKATAKVTAIDPNGLGIVMDWDVGGKVYTVGAIVSPDTVIKVGGKKGSMSDIKVGDTVTMVWERSDDVYAKEIVKK